MTVAQLQQQPTKRQALNARIDLVARLGRKRDAIERDGVNEEVVSKLMELVTECRLNECDSMATSIKAKVEQYKRILYWKAQERMFV